MEENQRNVTVSPSLIYNGNFSDPLPEGFKGFDRIYMHLFKDDQGFDRIDMHLFKDDQVIACCKDNNQINELLFQASQMYV